MKKILVLCLPALCMMGIAQTVSLKINDSIPYQEIFGFGGFGGNNNDAFITNLVNDLGMTINRQNYNFGSNATFDANQKPFMQALKAKADANGEPMQWFFSVWTPDASWKANSSVCDNTCSSKCNNVKDLSPSCNGTNNYLLPANYTNFATTAATFFKYVKTSTGIEPYGFSIQNESAFNEPYVSCKYTPTQYNALLKVTKEEFVKQGLTTHFLGAEDMGSAGLLANWTNVIFNDPVTVNYLDILAVHGYSDGINPANGDATGWSNMYSSASSRNKQLWMTETSGYDDTWAGNSFDLAKAIYLALKYGKVNAWVWWSLYCGGGVECLTTNGTPTKRYYVSKNYYRYIRPGAVHINSYSPTTDISVVAFKNAGNSTYTAIKPQFTVILINNATSAKTVSLTGRGMPATMKAYRTSSSENCVALADATTSSVSLPAQTITTLVYTGTNKGPSITQPSDIVIVKNTTNKTVSLTNVTVGSGETGTPTVTAVSNNKTLIPGAITITGTAPNLTLTFSPAANLTGTATIRIYVKDAGPDILNTTVVEFSVKVISAVNVAPTIDPIINYTVGLNNKSKKNYIWFSGVSDGNGGTQTISKPTMTFSNQSVLRLPYVNYTANATFGSIEFYPDQLGVTTVTLKLQDDGGTDLGGTDSKTITFTITVVADAPLLGIKENNEQTLAVFPNPAYDVINVILPDDSYSSLQVIDMTGKEVMMQSITATQIQLDASGLNNGIYFIIAKGESGTVKAKVFVNK